jgi:lipopolysaccharide heptosyltransferase II
MEKGRLMEASYQRVLIVKLRALGDVIISTPVITNLRKAIPHAEIVYLTEPGYDEPLRGNPYLDEIVLVPRMPFFTSNLRLGEPPQIMRRLKRRCFDLAIDLFGNPRSALLILLSGARTRVGYRYRVRSLAYNVKVTPRYPRYVVEFNLDVLRELGIPILTNDLYLPVSDEDRGHALRFIENHGLNGKRLVGLFPGGGWPAKRWTPSGYARLADLLNARDGVGVVIVGGPGEEGIVQEIIQLSRTHPVPVTGLSLMQAAALIATMDLMVGNDSAPQYLAIAMKTPSISLFGPTRHDNAIPQGCRHRVLRLGLPCSPCDRLTCQTMECMRSITAEQVMGMVDEMLVLRRSTRG